ncbi:peptide deformylase [Paracoccus sp. TK19116]|uniref:Peptide deformylase n=1 Tax=Paracoccus albicereus TaxID=2922394 RepID=A0ABT1MWK7_9RHOB|nr:peptide deformylase [Paracoccus albicereus]MCQ0971251.1 peptide deformylase [Paracoccus albicereus]
MAEAPATPAGADGTVLPIVLYPDPILSARCEPAAEVSGPELQRLAADMLATMYAAPGRGLAGPQVGVLRRIFVMDAGWKDGAPSPLVLLDPEILWVSDETASAEEGCLSIPGRPVMVTRPEAIEIAWFDLDGSHKRRRMSGVEARIAQHEADHLDGRLILDGQD